MKKGNLFQGAVLKFEEDYWCMHCFIVEKAQLNIKTLIENIYFNHYSLHYIKHRPTIGIYLHII